MLETPLTLSYCTYSPTCIRVDVPNPGQVEACRLTPWTYTLTEVYADDGAIKVLTTER